MSEKIFEFFAEKELLIIIDNIEDSLRKDNEAMKEFLSSLFIRCSGVKVLCTSRIQVHNIGDISEKVFILKELTSKYTIELLEKKSLRAITKSEIDDLLNCKQPSKLIYTTPQNHGKSKSS